MIKTITLEYARSLVPKRPDSGHKGTFGHLFVLAGSRGFTGAAKLTCEAAYRSGVGLVTAGICRPLADILACAMTEVMTLPLPATDAETLAAAAVEPALEFAGSKEAVVLGPGLSRHPETHAFILRFVRECPVPMLIDADGLNCLSEDMSALNDPPAARVLTPHPGEMARLTGLPIRDIQKNRTGTAAALAKKHGCLVVLKGQGTVVAAPGADVLVNSTGNSGLAKGGTGDVLSGIIGGLMAQGMAARAAAALGVCLHGAAGDIASEELTQRAMMASDVIEALPEAWREFDAED